ncbi:hypothetical protein Tco_1554909 [Tanacetum coccineum]
MKLIRRRQTAVLGQRGREFCLVAAKKHVDVNIVVERQNDVANSEMTWHTTLLGFNFLSSTMGTIDSMKSVLTRSVLDALCDKFHIHDVVHPELPGRNDRIRNSPADILEYFQINLSQLSVIAAAKVSHFEILCRVHGFVPIVVCYTRPLDSLKNWNDHFFWVDASAFPLVVPWHNNKTLRKDPHPTPAEFNANVCNYLADNPALFRKFLEPFLCFVGIIRYYDLDENCYPTFWANDDEEMDLFSFINHADPTKVRIRERVVAEGEVPLLQLTRGCVVPLAGVNNEGNANVHGAGNDNVNEEGSDAMPKKVIKKRKVADGASGSGLPPKKLREDHGTSSDVGASTDGNYLVAIQELFEQSTLNVEVGVTAAATVPFVTSSVTPTPERGEGGRTNSVTGPNLRTQRASERFVVLSYSSRHSSTNVADDEVTSIVRSSMLPPLVLTAAIATTIIVNATSALVPGGGTEPILHSNFRDSASTGETNKDVAEPSYPTGTELSTDSFFVSQDLRNMDYEQLFVKFNVGAARQTCLSSEAGWLKERDVEIANLKAQLSLKEVEAAEAIYLHGQIATVEAVEACRASELEGLKERNAALEGQVAALESAAVTKDFELASSNTHIAKLTQDLSNLQLSCDELSIKASYLEFEKDKLFDQVSKLEGTCSELRDEVSGYKLFKEQIEAVQDVQVKVLSDRVAELDANLIGMALYLDEELYPRYLTTIAGRRWILSRGLRLVVGLAAGIDHGKAKRDLTNSVAYDPSAEANYMSAVSALRAPSPEQLMLPIHRLEDQVVIGETSLSFSLNVANARVQRLKRNVVSQQLSISDALVPLIDSLSAKNLVGEASTSGVPATATTTVLSTTFIQASTVPPVPATDHEVSDVGSSTKVSSPPAVVFEKETFETTPEHGASD